VGCLHRNVIYVHTLGLCEVVVAGNLECEIAYLQISSLAWIAKGDSKHVRFLPLSFHCGAFFCCLKVISISINYLVSQTDIYNFFSFFPQDKRFSVKHCS